MKYLKMLGLAAIAGLALTAFAGAGTASATTLCKENKNPCPEGSRYALPQTISAATPAGEKATLTAGSFEVKCNSTASGTAEKNLGANKGIEGKISSLTFTACEGTCPEAKALNLPYKALAQATGSGNGTMTVTSSPFVGAELNKCFGFEKCVYGTASATLTITGDSPAHLTANVTLKRESGGFLCPAEGAWKATYVVSTPNPVWIEGEP